MDREDRVDPSRRAFLKRMGVTAAAAVWAVPTLQVVNMAAAHAHGRHDQGRNHDGHWNDNWDGGYGDHIPVDQIETSVVKVRVWPTDRLGGIDS